MPRIAWHFIFFSVHSFNKSPYVLLQTKQPVCGAHHRWKTDRRTFWRHHRRKQTQHCTYAGSCRLGRAFQTPQFDEYTLVSRGKKLIEADGEMIELHAGQSILIEGGTRARYSNPFDEPCEYWSICCLHSALKRFTGNINNFRQHLRLLCVCCFIIAMNWHNNRIISFH